MNLQKTITEKLRAIGTIELLTAIAVFAVLMTAGYQVYQLSVEAVVISKDQAEAELLARDLLELTVATRNEDWNAISPGQYYFAYSGGAYQLAAGEENVRIFTRSVTIEEVYRDASGNIVTSGGTLDNDIYKLTSRVNWSFRDRDFDVELVRYITNWRRF